MYAYVVTFMGWFSCYLYQRKRCGTTWEFGELVAVFGSLHVSISVWFCKQHFLYVGKAAMYFMHQLYKDIHTDVHTYIRTVHNALLVRHSFLAINSLWSAPDSVYVIVLQFYSVTSPTQWHYMYVSSMLVLVPALACWLVHVTGMKGSGCTVARTIGCTHRAACRKGLAGLREAYWVKVRWVVVQPMTAHHLWSQG